jgi:hypothetical protein
LARADGHAVIAGDCHEKGDADLFQTLPQRPVVPQASSAVNQANGFPAATARSIITQASCGLATNPMSSRMPAASHLPVAHP